MNHSELSDGFQRIADTHKGILFKVARTYCPYEEDRRDLMQEMMIQIWKSYPKYTPAFASASTWIYRICLNVAISFHRKNRKHEQISSILTENHDLTEESPDMEKENQVKLLEKWIHELNDLDRALVLLYMDDKSQTEIASITGLSLTNVSTKLNRIKEKLKLKFSLSQS